MLFMLSACHRAPAPLTVADDLAQLEPNRAAWPEALGDDPYPEVLSTVSGGDPSLYWAHGRGFLKVPLAEAFTAAVNPEVGVDRREVDEWEVTDDPMPHLDASYQVHNLVRDVITVEYTLWWRFEHQWRTAPSEGAPDLAVGQWSKTEGTPFIGLLEGSILLRQVPGTDVTEVELEEHLNATLRDDATLVSYLNDFYGNLLATVHGRPLPRDW